ncbi:hypothetical protein RhiJN_22527 [Ceratobasidium sp. AG-Ba]|nr:hypothetical protein RhiJN_22527 [Ceratobasidium sp. AG-Ba]
MSSNNTTPDTNENGPSYEDLQAEFVAVRARIRELELSNDAAERRIAELEHEKANTEYAEGSITVCAWHAHHGHQPTQSAKPGHLGCGCTIQEALFEESMARHGVGSMYSEAPMMDPTLRKPLLQLLQRRYHYVDGSLEVAHEPADDRDEVEEEEEGNFALAAPRLENSAATGHVGTAIATRA